MSLPTTAQGPEPWPSGGLAEQLAHIQQRIAAQSCPDPSVHRRSEPAGETAIASPRGTHSAGSGRYDRWARILRRPRRAGTQ
jgi:hypothetical protein